MRRTPPTIEQTPIDDLDVLQPSSLPSPPVSNLETVEPKLWLMRPPPFPPPASSASSSSSSIPCAEVAPLSETPDSYKVLEQFVVNSTRREDTLLTGAATPCLNALPRSDAATTAIDTGASAAASAAASAIPAPQIPNFPFVPLGDDDFTFEDNDFILFDDDDPDPTPPHSLFPTL